MLGTAKKLTRKQVSAFKRALNRQGFKLPKVGWCFITTKQGGKYSRTVVSSARRTSEVCHYVVGGKHEYWVRSSRPLRVSDQIWMRRYGYKK